MFRLICLCIGYCIGCIETAYVVGRIWQVDLRQHGSGNLGTTNALRVLGKKAGALVFIGDIMKSVIAFVICRAIFGSNLAGVYGSVGAVLGHNYPFYLKFKGGKGIAVMIGMTAAMAFSMDIRLAIPKCTDWLWHGIRNKICFRWLAAVCADAAHQCLSFGLPS